jgi:predicted secreted protein
MAEKEILGKDLMLFKKNTQGNYVAWGAATSHSIQITTSMQNISHKDTGKWGNSKPSVYSWTMSSENIFIIKEEDSPDDDISDYNDLLEMMITEQQLSVSFDLVANPSDGGKPAGGWLPSGKGWEGDVYITDVSANAPYEGVATYSIQFTGTGPLKREAPTKNEKKKKAHEDIIYP